MKDIYQTSSFTFQALKAARMALNGCGLRKTVPHLAFVVQDLDYELSSKKFKILANPGSPSEGIRVAMILHNGAPVELIEYTD